MHPWPQACPHFLFRSSSRNSENSDKWPQCCYYVQTLFVMKEQKPITSFSSTLTYCHQYLCPFGILFFYRLQIINGSSYLFCTISFYLVSYVLSSPCLLLLFHFEKPVAIGWGHHFTSNLLKTSAAHWAKSCCSVFFQGWNNCFWPTNTKVDVNVGLIWHLTNNMSSYGTITWNSYSFVLFSVRGCKNITLFWDIGRMVMEFFFFFSKFKWRSKDDIINDEEGIASL